jgi:hypothetical protein
MQPPLAPCHCRQTQRKIIVLYKSLPQNVKKRKAIGGITNTQAKIVRVEVVKVVAEVAAIPNLFMKVLVRTVVIVIKCRKI